MKLNGHLSYLLYCAAIAGAAPLQKRAGTSYNGGTTANDVNDGICADVTLIFARGSTELGNMGETVGPALAKQLISDLGADKVAIQGVDYPATIESNISLGSEGGPTMAQLAEKALKQCPNTKIALGGYSQGAMVAHFAVAQGGLSASDVSSAVLYGDPEDGSSVGDLPSSRLKEFCATGDGVCETHSFDITAAHLSYATGPDIGIGANFIVQNAGMVSSSGSASNVSSTVASGSSSATSSDVGLGSIFPSSFPTSTSGSGGLGSLFPSGLPSSIPSLGGISGTSGGDLGDLGDLGSLLGSNSTGFGGLSSLGSLGSFIKKLF